MRAKYRTPMHTLIPEPAVAPLSSPSQLFVDVVFDRPLDHAYTYSVPDHLRTTVGVGKRVSCSFGRGEKDSVGYVIRVADIPPVRVPAAAANGTKPEEPSGTTIITPPGGGGDIHGTPPLGRTDEPGTP